MADTTPLWGGWTLENPDGLYMRFVAPDGTHHVLLKPKVTDMLRSLAAERDALLKALRAVEYSEYHPSWELGVPGKWGCYICGAEQGESHSSFCVVGQALTPAQQEVQP